MTSIAAACRLVLSTADPIAKVKVARAAARAWRRGALAYRFDVAMPVVPARPAEPVLLSPARMPKRGKGSAAGRIALLHALAHIECVAIDLAFDAAGRFGAAFPRDFVDDWLSVGADEAMHFALLARRLKALGSHYGALPAHAGLWDAAAATAYDAGARLAVVPMVLEARGLDVTPPTVARLEAAGDGPSARILRRIFADEIRHVRYGSQWFAYVCATRGFPPEPHWRSLVAAHVPGVIKPPFNDSARADAGLTRELYAGLAPA